MKLLFAAVLFGLAQAQSSQKLCPDGFVFENYTTHSCYHISEKLFNFDDAVAYCIDQAASLAFINSYFDKEPIANLTSSLMTTAWLGARRDANGTFRNLDNTTVYNFNWLSGEPSAEGSCVTERGVAPSGMRAIPCYSLQPALCTKEAAICNGGSFGGLYTRSGNITSPNYPNYYYNNLDCQYLITSPIGTYVTINFSPYFVEDDYDYVVLYDGNSTSSKVLGSITDSYYWSKKSFESTGNQLLVRFRTDRSGTDHGWLASWAAKLDQPDINQTGQTGNFTSPNYPSNYPNYSEQFYYILGTYGFKINVTFTDFVTESTYDPLVLYDSYSVDSTKIIDTISGRKTVPFSYVTTSNYLTMKFTSDISMNYQGFSGYWNIV